MLIRRRVLLLLLTVVLLCGCHQNSDNSSASKASEVSASKLVRLPDVQLKYGDVNLANKDTVVRHDGNILTVKATLPSHFTGQLLLDGRNVVEFGAGENTWKYTDKTSDPQAYLATTGLHRITLNLYPTNSGTRAGTTYRTFFTR